MKYKVLIILLFVFNLNAETIEESKEILIKDIEIFDKKFKRFSSKEFQKKFEETNNLIILETKRAKYRAKLDFITIKYLFYKQGVRRRFPYIN